MTVMVADTPDWSWQGIVNQVPNEPANFNNVADGHLVLPTLTGGHYYLYGWDMAVDATGTAGFYYLYDNESEKLFAVVYLNPGESASVELGGYTPINGVKVSVAGTDTYMVIRYALGP
jgi:hypothetical protein